MVGEVAYHRQRQTDAPDYKQMARSFINARLGRLGMTFTQHQVEQGQS